MAQPHTLMLTLLITATILLAICLAGWVLCAIRNEWVYHQRVALNDRFYIARVARINAGEVGVTDEPWWTTYYMSYGQMMWRFWCWDIERMRLPSAPQTVGE
jgi:hypothetical protein